MAYWKCSINVKLFASNLIKVYFIKKTGCNLIKKWEEELNRHISKVEMQMANRCMKIYSSLILKKCKSKSQWDINYLTPERRLSPKRTQITNVDKDVDKRELLYTVSGNINWCNLLWKTRGLFMEVSQETKICSSQRTTYDPAIPLLGVYPKNTPLIRKYMCIQCS